MGGGRECQSAFRGVSSDVALISSEQLSHHWAYATTLQHQTLRAQSAARVAAAFLADAEAERLAASERRQVADAHLAASSLGVGSIMAVPGL